MEGPEKKLSRRSFLAMGSAAVVGFSAIASVGNALNSRHPLIDADLSVAEPDGESMGEDLEKLYGDLQGLASDMDAAADRIERSNLVVDVRIALNNLVYVEEGVLDEFPVDSRIEIEGASILATELRLKAGKLRNESGLFGARFGVGGDHPDVESSRELLAQAQEFVN